MFYAYSTNNNVVKDISNAADDTIQSSRKTIDSDIILNTYDKLTNAAKDEDDVMVARSQSWLKILETGKFILDKTLK